MDVKALIDNFKRVVTRHYADFDGREGRAAFWQYVLVYLVIAMALAILRLRLLSTLLMLGLLLPTFAILVRRMHDIDRTGWLALLPAVPGLLMVFLYLTFWPLSVVFGLTSLICLGYVVYLCAEPGTTGANEFGPDPETLQAP
jgi:uncharacterized membrane protein YhaH (DUF805 family)